MRIVIMEGFGSSSHFQPSSSDYMGKGSPVEDEIAAADVVIAVWPPSDAPIVLKAPDGVEVIGAHWAWDPKGRQVSIVPSTTGEAEDERIHSEWHDRQPKR